MKQINIAVIKNGNVVKGSITDGKIIGIREDATVQKIRLNAKLSSFIRKIIREKGPDILQPK